jgi:hypothetical protein
LLVSETNNRITWNDLNFNPDLKLAETIKSNDILLVYIFLKIPCFSFVFGYDHSMKRGALEIR